MIHTRTARAMLAVSALALLSACEEGLDFDLRGLGGGFSTADAAQAATAARPSPDDRGVISYPNYQVAVARQGDTVSDVAARVGLSTATLARFNGLDPNVPLREGEIIALPSRVAEPSPATGAIGTGPIRPAPVDVTTLADQAIDNAPATPAAQPQPQTGAEPIRHRVERGETAFTIARLYQVPVRALAQWNGLGADYAVREGQFLLIPVAEQAPPETTAAAATPPPGSGTPTPTPPSASQPLPDDSDTAPAAQAPRTAQAPVADIGPQAPAPSQARFAMPVQGSIIRDYAKGRNDGISIKGEPGGIVSAADAGTVAAITETTEGTTIVVVRHANNLLMVYANVTGVKVAKGDEVRRGQGIATLRQGNDSFVHFEVRNGFDSVDPNDYLG